ncbi:MAG TPA: hypothetical protein DD407_01850, partial [Pseudohongiella sp.]|nr:hypothetical protein [Pseudohongiella sp.]
DLKAIKTISMVIKDGNVYFPSDIYPEFGIRPFTPAPTIVSGAEGGLVQSVSAINLRGTHPM